MPTLVKAGTPSSRHQPSRVRPEKQIAEGAAQQIIEPPLRQMVRAVVDHVTALTPQVAQPVVARIVIEMGRR
jgi:hypothetical protein